MIGPLAAWAVSTGSVTLQMLALPPGSYFLLACTDLQRAVAETDETNNCTASAGTVTYPVIDLAVASLGDPPAAVAQADSFEASVATVNMGNSPTPASETRFWLSLDEVPGGDIPLRGAMTSELAGGTTHSAMIRVAVEITTPQAEYFIIPCADATSVVAEASETNNCRTSAGRVTVTGAQPADGVSIHLLGRVYWPPPRAGEPVLVHDAAGTLVAKVATDATGTATVDVPPGGTITVVEVSPRMLTTFHGVKSGDQLTAGDLWRADQPLGTTTVILTADPPPGSYVSVEGPCTGGISTSAEIEVNLYDGCTSGPRPLLAILASADDGTLLGSIFDPTVSLEPGGTAVLEGSMDPPASAHRRSRGPSSCRPRRRVSTRSACRSSRPTSCRYGRGSCSATESSPRSTRLRPPTTSSAPTPSRSEPGSGGGGGRPRRGRRRWCRKSGEKERPQRDLNPCRRRERPVS